MATEAAEAERPIENEPATENEKPVTVVHTEKFETLSPDLAKVLRENKPGAFSSGYIRMYLMCMLIYLCSTMNGQS